MAKTFMHIFGHLCKLFLARLILEVWTQAIPQFTVTLIGRELDILSGALKAHKNEQSRN